MDVFRSRRALNHHYTPPSLPHREEELEMLWSMFRPVLSEQVSVKTHVHGPIGSGKTALCRRFGADLQQTAREMDKDLLFLHINMAYTPTPHQLATRLLENISFTETPSTGISAEAMLISVAEEMRHTDHAIVLALDEVDTYLKEGGSPKILYTLSRIHETQTTTRSSPASAQPQSGGGFPGLSLIYISRSLGWMKKLDPATLDTLGRGLGIELNEYTQPEVRDILGYRAEEASFTGAISEQVIDFISRIAMSQKGIRYALELLLAAGTLAENKAAEGVSPEHVRTAHSQIPKGLNGGLYPSQLSLHSLLLLTAIIKTLRGARYAAYTPLETAWYRYRELCKLHEKKPKKQKNLRSNLEDLIFEGYIIRKQPKEKELDKQMKGEGEGDGDEEGDYTLIGTDIPIHRMNKPIKRALKHALGKTSHT